MRRWLDVWSLRSHLSALLLVTVLLTFALVGGAMMAYWIPEIDQASERTLQADVQEAGDRVEQLMGVGQARLQLLAPLLDAVSPERAERILDSGTYGMLSFKAIYSVSAQGRVQAVGLSRALRDRRADLLGSDLSAVGLFRQVSESGAVGWRGNYLSALTGRRAVAVAVPDGRGGVLIAEVPREALLEAVRAATSRGSSAVWVVARNGDIIADNQQGREVGKHNIRNWPLMQAQLRGEDATSPLHFAGKAYHAAVAHAPALDWYLVGRSPMGLDNPLVRKRMLFVVASFGACLLIALLIAPLWVGHLARPFQEIVARAEQARLGRAMGLSWPRGSVREFNSLSADLESMAATLEEREEKSHAIFNASPVVMAVTTLDEIPVLIDVNEAWCRELQRERSQVLGRPVSEQGGMRSPQDLAQLLGDMRGGRSSTEAWMMRVDGEPILMQAFGGKTAALETERLAVWAFVEIGPLRRAEHQLQELNQQLEARVARRTRALTASNAELSQMVEQLQLALRDLVRAEKMAALGKLVAGVAQELNTPLGNGVMAVSAMADATRGFKAAMRGGLKRADLLQFVEQVEQGSAIASRNLRRAAELVQSFKQVAVDRSSAHRRSFELAEVVHEMVTSLRPSLLRTPHRIELDVPETGLRLESYPGALGEVLGNLIQNAMEHGFDGRGQGRVRIRGARAPDGRIVLRVVDNGKGIAPDQVGRIFEPFMTTRRDRSGSGLGLPICRNAVEGLLGGTMTVHSIVGRGTVFEMRLPPVAPVASPSVAGGLHALD